MEQVITFINQSNNIPFVARLVKKGNVLMGGEKHTAAAPIIEFYDNRYWFTQFGQFISSYYVGTLLQEPLTGLALDGCVPEWFIDSDSCYLITKWLKNNI